MTIIFASASGSNSATKAVVAKARTKQKKITLAFLARL
jgi:hypothetical protein